RRGRQVEIGAQHRAVAHRDRDVAERDACVRGRRGERHGAEDEHGGARGLKRANDRRSGPLLRTHGGVWLTAHRRSSSWLAHRPRWRCLIPREDLGPSRAGRDTRARLPANLGARTRGKPSGSVAAMGDVPRSGLTAKLAERAAILKLADVPEDVVELARHALLDWFAV